MYGLVRRSLSPPENLEVFVAEIAAGIAELYGAAAGEAYRERAPRGFGAALAAPGAAIFLLGNVRGQAVGLLLATPREEAVDFPLIHVLKGHTGRGAEGTLVAAAAAHYQRVGERVILCEAVPYAPLDLDNAFVSQGFSATRRGLFRIEARTLAEAALARVGSPVCRGIRSTDFGAVGQCIALAYAGHPGRQIHPEVCDAAGARCYLLRVLSGAFGPVLPSYVRVCQEGGSVLGCLLGCEIAPGVGFVVQLAVLPEARGRGIATRLLGEFGQACVGAGVYKIALGVTLEDPARRLYEHLGFTMQRAISSYSWWANPG